MREIKTLSYEVVHCLASCYSCRWSKEGTGKDQLIISDEARSHVESTGHAIDLQTTIAKKYFKLVLKEEWCEISTVTPKSKKD